MKTNTFHCSSKARRGRGMSLIEILVGLAIALIAMLIVFQVFSSSGERVRTTTSGSDAQIAGSLALYQLEHDLSMAGMGFGALPAAGTSGGVAGCTVAAHQSALAAPDFTFPLAPVQIIPNLTPGAPVQIAVTYGDSAYFVQSRDFTASTNSSKSLVLRDAFQLGDMVLVTNKGNSAAAGVCALVQITGNTNPDGLTVDHDAVNPPATPFPFYSASTYPAGTVTPFTMNAAAGAATFVAATGTAYNLGPTPNRNLWQVTPAGAANPNMLVWNNTLRSDARFQVAEGIVNLQAEYGVDDGGGAAGAAATPPAAAGDQIISPSEWTSNVPTDWSLLLAVRFAVLVRSQQYETAAVTTVAPQWGNGAHNFTMFNVDGKVDSAPGNANDWRHYRYRVYEATVPLRNMIWGK